MKRCGSALLALLLAPALAGAWGWQAHKLITELAIERLPEDVRAVYAPLMAQVLEQCVAPDKKVRTDPREQRKHYLNVECLDPGYIALWQQEHPGKGHKRRKKKKDEDDDDADDAKAPKPNDDDGPNTPPLQAKFFTGHMPMPPDRVDGLFARIPRDIGRFHQLPKGLQKEIGTVVYQPAEYHAELVKAFQSNDPARIAGVTGYLSHYVADLHVPLHNTINHEGAFYGSPRAAKGVHKTVHSRFESGFVGFLGPALRGLAAPHVTSPTPPADITARAIAAARAAYAHHLDVLVHDGATMRFHRGKTVQWKRFYAQLEPKMAPLAAKQVAGAAQLLADVIVSAWRESRR
jgi:hypothetical protein